ncbi:hypothetical protein QF015_002175 [Paenarthrobacter sp. TE4293]|uniref:helix-turn-helix domain-containing protein n=1 Tax=Paenarthrobacter sp. TE4293 TaxID=3381695 RepID=UPI003D24D1B3
MTTPQRQASAYVHGVGSPVVVLPGRVCAWLERYAKLNEVRIQNRGADAEVDAVLVAVRLAALAWRDAATGSSVAAKPEAATDLKRWFTTTQAGDKIGITDRAVRLAIKEHRLKASNIDGRWRIALEDIEHFKAAKAAAA